MTISEHLEMSRKGLEALREAYPDAYLIEEQSDGTPDPLAVGVVYDRRDDRRRKAGYRLVPRGAVRLRDAAKGDTKLRKQLRGWEGK